MYKFITDNPYRLLTLPSSTSLRLLRQKALAAEQAVRVGLPIEVSLADAFGSDDLILCSDLVRSLFAHATTRTLHRQMWPYQLRPQSGEGGFPLATLPSDADALPGFHTRQWRFLRYWFDFILHHHQPSLTLALDHFAGLYNDKEHNDYLEGLLREDGDNGADIYNTVVDARSAMAVFLTQEACTHALEMLKEGKQSQFRIVLRAIQNCPLKTEGTGRAVMDSLITFGNREREGVDQEYQQMGARLAGAEWSPLWAAFDFSRVTTLHELASALGEHSSASLWQASAYRYVDLISNAMRQYAVTAANDRDDYEEAESVLHQVLDLPGSPSLSKQVTADLSTLEVIKAERDENRRITQGDADADIVRTRALRLADERGEFNRAYQLLKEALDLPISGEMRHELEADMRGVGALLNAEAQAAPSSRKEAQESRRSAIRPVTSAPPLFTLNGCGVKLYGRDSYPDDPKWHYTTLFLTILFFPVIPLARYLVSDAPQGRVNFHATAPFTRWHQAHRAAGVLAAFWFAFSLFQPSTSPTGGPTLLARPTPRVSEVAPAPRPTAEAADSQRRRRNMIAEGEGLEADVSSLAAWMKEADAVIDADRQKLQEGGVVLTAHEDQIALDRQFLDRYDAGAVARFNGTLEGAKREQRDHNRDVRAFNVEVSQRNKVLRRSQSEQQRIGEIGQGVNTGQ